MAGKLMSGEKNRRRHERLPLRFDVLCQKVGQAGGKVFIGRTLNVSSGGALLEINGGGLNDGELLSVDMSVPPTEGLLEYGGRFSSYARVVRIDRSNQGKPTGNGSLIETIALEFCESPRLRV